jgi:hypothetical protein
MRKTPLWGVLSRLKRFLHFSSRSDAMSGYLGYFAWLWNESACTTASSSGPSAGLRTLQPDCHRQGGGQQRRPARDLLRDAFLDQQDGNFLK